MDIPALTKGNKVLLKRVINPHRIQIKKAVD